MGKNQYFIFKNTEIHNIHIKRKETMNIKIGNGYVKMKSLRLAKSGEEEFKEFVIQLHNISLMMVLLNDVICLQERFQLLKTFISPFAEHNSMSESECLSSFCSKIPHGIWSRFLSAKIFTIWRFNP